MTWSSRGRTASGFLGRQEPTHQGSPGTEKKIEGKETLHIPSLVLIRKGAETHLAR